MKSTNVEFEKIYMKYFKNVYTIVIHSFTEQDEVDRCIIQIFLLVSNRLEELNEMDESEIRNWMLCSAITKIKQRQKNPLYWLKKKMRLRKQNI